MAGCKSITRASPFSSFLKNKSQRQRGQIIFSRLYALEENIVFLSVMHQLKSCFSSLSCNCICQCYSKYQSLSEMFWHHVLRQGVSLAGSMLGPYQPRARYVGLKDSPTQARWTLGVTTALLSTLSVQDRERGLLKICWSIRGARPKSCGKGQDIPRLLRKEVSHGYHFVTEKWKAQSRAFCLAWKTELSLLLEIQFLWQELLGPRWFHHRMLSLRLSCLQPTENVLLLLLWSHLPSPLPCLYCCQNHKKRC